ncbi:MAG: hypothetical protein CL840_08865 [Crocinitomicaceae bacterium]|nr:hypothetical protein [Crocinitomicaceae bacterium]|tara:strand:- start:67592 stop:67936 length:345 start_codon:yes stop_codon:yes gene_type:complete
MPGEGSAFNMISVLKNNKALLRNKNFFLLRSEYLKAAEKRNIDLQKASPEELKKVRNELIEYNKKQTRKKILGLLIVLVATPLLIWGAIILGQWIFGDSPDLKILKKESLDQIR